MSVNRIFCIGKNYAEHVAELAHLGHAARADESATSVRSARESARQARPAPTSLREGTVSAPDTDCVVFLKPASAVVEEGQPIMLPKKRGSIHHEAELVVQLTGGGRDIPLKHALDSVAGIALGLDLTLRDLQTELKAKGKPWELAKAFDGAAPLGDFRPYLDQDLQDIEFTCHVNNELRQRGNTRDMLYTVKRQIHILSQTWSLEPGDVIYTGTPKGVGPLVPGDHVVLESALTGRYEWRCK
ncbi:MAG: fumarylacetoacetate hydrolase family protein [Pseudomonadota bacterium]|nr:fumarylacetoacetate hydrolase family protein [Pseudomonadota bacterium]